MFSKILAVILALLLPGAALADGIANSSGGGAAISLPLSAANGGTGDTGSAWAQLSPTPTPSSGAFTSASAIVRFKQIGKTVFVQGSVTVTTLGTASGRVKVSLPVATSAVIYSLFSAVRDTTVLFAAEYDVAGSVSIDLAGATNGSVLRFSGVYEAQ